MRMGGIKGGEYWWLREMAQVFAHHLAVTLCLSVCAPSHLAPGAFLGPTGRGVRWFLGSFLLGKKTFLMESIPSFVVLRFVGNLFRPTLTRLCCSFVMVTFGVLIRPMCLSGVGTARFGCEVWKRQTFALFALSLVQELFFCFQSPCSTQYYVRGLKTTVCRECVIVEFLWQASSLEEHC